MPGIYARVGENLAKGMNITEATKDGTGDAESDQVDRDEDYNTRYASYRGYMMAFERTKPIPRRAADFSLTALTAAAGATTPEAVVDHLAARFLSVPLGYEGSRRVHRLRPQQAAAPPSRRCASCSTWCSSTPEYQVN